jgi:hypothetical protein
MGSYPDALMDITEVQMVIVNKSVVVMIIGTITIMVHLSQIRKMICPPRTQ